MEYERLYSTFSCKMWWLHHPRFKSNAICNRVTARKMKREPVSITVFGFIQIIWRWFSSEKDTWATFHLLLFWTWQHHGGIWYITMFRQYFHSNTLCAFNIFYLSDIDNDWWKELRLINIHNVYSQTGNPIGSPKFYCDIETQLSQHTTLKINIKSHLIDIFWPYH